MKIGIGSDHRGYQLKESLRAYLAKLGHQVKDFGSSSEKPVDYPDFALPLARAIAARRLERGILVCSSGIGMSIAANKVRGVRAALCCNELMAIRSRQHNDANVLCLGADSVSTARAKRILNAWLNAEFEAGRHQRRLAKIRRYER